MKYYKQTTTGEVFAFESEEERDEWGPEGLIEMSPEEVTAHLSPPPVDAGVPRVVTMRQARLALLGAGLLQQVDLAIDALPEPQRSAARIEWDYSSEVHRDRAFVQQLGHALGLSDEQLDALFIQAAAL